MNKTNSAKIREYFAPQVHRRFRSSRRRAGTGLQPPVRRRACRGAGPGRRQHRGQRVGRRQAGRHLRNPRRARGNGTGHAHRACPAGCRRARVRLEKSADRADHPWPEPGPQARLARHGDRRQPRHPRLARLRPPGRRRGAHDAHCRRRPISGKSRSASFPWPTASSRTRALGARRPTARSRQLQPN